MSICAKKVPTSTVEILKTYLSNYPPRSKEININVLSNGLPAYGSGVLFVIGEGKTKGTKITQLRSLVDVRLLPIGAFVDKNLPKITKNNFKGLTPDMTPIIWSRIERIGWTSPPLKAASCIDDYAIQICLEHHPAVVDNILNRCNIPLAYRSQALKITRRHTLLKEIHELAPSIDYEWYEEKATIEEKEALLQRINLYPSEDQKQRTAEQSSLLAKQDDVSGEGCSPLSSYY
jgi:hypothetical protein